MERCFLLWKMLRKWDWISNWHLSSDQRVPLLPQQQLEKTASQRGSSQWSKQCWPSHSRPSPRGSQWWWPAASSWMTGNMLLSCDVCLDHLEVLEASASPLAVVAMHSSSHLNGFFSSSVMKFSWFLRMQKSQQMVLLHFKWARYKELQSLSDGISSLLHCNYTLLDSLWWNLQRSDQPAGPSFWNFISVPFNIPLLSS